MTLVATGAVEIDDDDAAVKKRQFTGAKLLPLHTTGGEVIFGMMLVMGFGCCCGMATVAMCGG